MNIKIFYGHFAFKKKIKNDKLSKIFNFILIFFRTDSIKRHTKTEKSLLDMT